MSTRTDTGAATAAPPRRRTWNPIDRPPIRSTAAGSNVATSTCVTESADRLAPPADATDTGKPPTRRYPAPTAADAAPAAGGCTDCAVDCVGNGRSAGTLSDTRTGAGDGTRDRATAPGIVGPGFGAACAGEAVSPLATNAAQINPINVARPLRRINRI